MAETITRGDIIEALEAGKITHERIGLVRAHPSYGHFFTAYPQIEEDLRKQLAGGEQESAGGGESKLERGLATVRERAKDAVARAKAAQEAVNEAGGGKDAKSESKADGDDGEETGDAE